MRRIIAFLACCIAFLISSCSKSNVEVSGELSEDFISDKSCLRIPMSKETLSEDDAKTVALNLCGRHGTKSINPREASEVLTINDRSNAPAIYVVNFEDDGGFVLVSATKKYYPILAEAEVGHFNLNFSDSGLEYVMNDYLETISYCKTLPSDSLAAIRRLWKEYEYQDESPYSQTKSGIDVEGWSTTRTYWESRWQSEGKTWYQLQTKPYDMPQEMYEEFLDVAERECNEDYPYLYYCYITEKSTFTPSDTYGPLLETTWSNGLEYSDLTLTYPVDQATVAVGQVMRYYEYPNLWNWSSMPNNYASNTTRLFLKNIYLWIHGSTEGTESLTLASYLENNGYDAESYSHNSSRVYSEIISGRPVIRYASPNYSWVSCGYKTLSSLNIRYDLYVVGLDTYPLPELEQIYSDDVDTAYGHNYYYQNWCDAAAANGWYLEGQNSSGGNINTTTYDVCCELNN